MKIDDFFWQLKGPECFKSLDDIPDWLLELRRFRGKVLYEDGLRPDFFIDGRFDDPDPIDHLSYHILAKRNGLIKGSIRFTPLNSELDCTSQRILGARAFLNLLKKNEYLGKDLVEVGRWTVSSCFKNSLLGFFLGVGGMSFTNKLKLKPFAHGGHKLSHLIFIFGGKFFKTDPGPYYIKKYNDEIFFIDLDANKAHKKAIGLMPFFEGQFNYI